MKPLGKLIGYDLGHEDFTRPEPGTPPKPPATNDLIASRHLATGQWVGPLRIVEIKVAPDGREQIAATRHDGSGGWIVVTNGYGDAFNQWRYASEVQVWTRNDVIIDQLLRSNDIDGEEWSRLSFWANNAVPKP